MRHLNCGGIPKEDGSGFYEYQHDDGTVEHIDRLICDKCSKEIIGDKEIEIRCICDCFCDGWSTTDYCKECSETCCMMGNEL